ncbi:hypothetical protein [Kordia sp.]|uniref:hypothetical protein n=1 Tax=Kordia sp. TaxID=1965332 RepID=UPI003B5CD1C6
MRFYSIILCILLFSCAKQEQKTVTAPVVVRSNLTTAIAFQNCIKFDDGYVVSTKNNELYYLNTDFQIDEVRTKEIQPNIDAEYFYVYRGKMLLAISYEDDDPTYFLNENAKWTLLDFEESDAIFYEDETYIVTTICHGEFGGTVFFKHKKTNKIYSCKATCLVDISKSEDAYYLTTNLAHMIGFSEIIKVNDPTKLKALGDREATNNWWMKAGMSHEELKKGTEIMLDTTNVLTFDSFIINDKVYTMHESSSEDFAFSILNPNIVLSIVEEGRLKNIDTLLRYPPEMSLETSQRTNDGAFFYFNADSDAKGSIITVKNDTVRVISLKKAN